MTSDSPGNRTPTSTSPPRHWHGWLPLAITTVLSTVLVVILLSRREDRPPMESTPPAETKPVPPMRVRALPLPPGVAPELSATTPPRRANTPALHSIVLEERDGAQVWRIRANPDGDELIVDFATGRLLGVRDAKGKMTPWPMSSANAPELPQKNSERPRINRMNGMHGHENAILEIGVSWGGRIG